MSQFIVINEEYGFRFHACEASDAEVDKVIEWWKNLDSVLGMFFHPQHGFPLALKPLQDGDDFPEMTKENVALLLHLHEDDDSYLKIINFKGRQKEVVNRKVKK